MGLTAWVKEGLDRRQVVTTALIALFVYLFATIFFFRPMVRSWQNKREEVDAAKLKLTRYEKLVSQKDSLLKELDEYKDRYTRKQSHDEEVSVFLKQLEEMVTTAGLKMNNLRPIANEQPGDLDTVVIELTIEGEMEQFVNFLHLIASAQDLLDVRTISLQRRTTCEGHLGITGEATTTLLVAKP